jgi:hypothetical protein
MSCVPCPTLNAIWAERWPASRLATSRTWYSSRKPESRSRIGGRWYRLISAQRSSTSSGRTFTAGSGLPSLRVETRALFGLSTLSGAVTPASLTTFTRNARVPPCASAGRARPWLTFTRLSGLISTIASACASSTASNSATAAASSAFAIASLMRRRSSSRSGSPRCASALSSARTCCANGWSGVCGAGAAARSASPTTIRSLMANTKRERPAQSSPPPRGSLDD